MTSTASLRSLMIALYKNDKSCAHQHMVAICSGNLTYCRTDQEARLKSAKVRKEQRKQSYPKIQSVNMVPLTRSSISLQWKNPSYLSSTVMVCDIGEKNYSI